MKILTNKLNLLHLYLILDRPIAESVTQLRGFIGRQFVDYTELHHHLKTNTSKKMLVYEYPKIQYKIHKNNVILLAIGDTAIQVLKQVVLTLKELILGNNTYRIQEIKVHYQESEFGLTHGNEKYRYMFITPWLALNEKNYQAFVQSSLSDRRELLERILVGNLLSFSKSLGYRAPETIHVAVELYPFKVYYKNIPLVGFKGLFETNFFIPDYLGIGKAVSHGYGTVKKIEPEINQTNGIYTKVEE